ncbi:MAG: outer membrane protein assembly factor BamD [Verrucomicrobiota bacterium]
MLPRFFLICLAVFLAATISIFAQNTPSTEEDPEIQRQLVNPSITPEEQIAFDDAQTNENSESPEAAISAYRRFIKNNPASPLAAKAQFRIANLFEDTGRSSKAFDAYQKLVTQYPDTDDFEKAVARQVVIANEYLGGKKLVFLGLPILPGTDRAEEMFASIVKNAPFSKNAPIAQFNLGVTYERQGKLKEAASAYQTVLDRYPNSSIADDALYQIGYIYMRVGETGRSQDLSAIISSKNTFEDFVLQYPQSEKVPQADDNINKLSDEETGDLLDIAKFYDRSKQFRAAAIYYNDVIRRAPDSEDARLARDRVQVLRSEVGDDALRSGPEQVETGVENDENDGQNNEHGENDESHEQNDEHSNEQNDEQNGEQNDENDENDEHDEYLAPM